jgi:hypothetical protein
VSSTPSASPDQTQAAATQTAQAVATQTAQAVATQTAQAVATQTASGAAPQAGVEVGGLRTDQNAFDPRRGPLRIWGALDAPGRADLELYDIAGRRLGSLLGAELPAGRWDAVWDGRDEHGRDLGSDLYLLLLRQPGVVRVFKTALLKD